MKFNMDVKSLVFIITTACVAAGYYYNTEARLDVCRKRSKVSVVRGWGLAKTKQAPK